jgi:hypothetical protein
MSYAQILSAAIEAKVYETLHSLLKKVSEDYDLDHGVLVDRYLIQGREGSPPPQFIYKPTEGSVVGDCEDEKPKKVKKAKVKVTKKAPEEEDDRAGKCKALTAKGTPCKNKAFGGGCNCRVHTPKDTEVKEPKAKKEPKGRKSKAKEPEHTHKMDELASGDCELCETHGNPLDGEQEFEVENAADIVAALRAEESDDDKTYLEEEEDELSESELADLAAELEGAMSEEELD